MTPNTPEDPPRPTHQEILEEEQDMTNHFVDVLPRCHRIMKLGQEGIDRGLFLYDSEVRGVLDAIMGKARKGMQYRKQCRNMGDRVCHTQ